MKHCIQNGDDIDFMLCEIKIMYCNQLYIHVINNILITSFHLLDKSSSVHIGQWSLTKPPHVQPLGIQILVRLLRTIPEFPEKKKRKILNINLSILYQTLQIQIYF